MSHETSDLDELLIEDVPLEDAPLEDLRATKEQIQRELELLEQDTRDTEDEG